MDQSQVEKPKSTKENTTSDEKEMKAKRKYYGKVFVTLIFLLILYEYFVYVYEIMWHRINCKIKFFILYYRS